MNINDKRMQWILNIEKLKKDDSGSFYAEYELASECNINGSLNYENESILCGPLTIEKDDHGLYQYLLKIKLTPHYELFDLKKATRKGYYFKDGIIGEILSIMSVYFKCRFFPISLYRFELTKNSLKTKQNYKFDYFPFNPALHPSIFSNKRKNFNNGFSDFLNLIKLLKPALHMKFILACYHYSRALKEIGKDQEMVFIRLVSSIEALSKDFILEKKDDLFKGKELNEIIINNLNEEEKGELKTIFENRKTKKKFIRFIEKHSKGFFKGGNYKNKNTRIFKKDLEDTLKAIYSARSNYLHEGLPMYLSQVMKGKDNWDQDPSLGMIIDRRRISNKHKLPYTNFFERLIRHCLLNYLEENQL